MKRRKPVLAWKATVIFYLVLLVSLTLVSVLNGVNTFSYWLIQVALMTLGVGLFVLIGNRYANFSAESGVLLAFGLGIFTIIPAVLMSLNPPGDFWQQYFPIGLAMAAGSLLTFGFIEVIKKLNDRKNPPASFKRDDFKRDEKDPLSAITLKEQAKLMQLQDPASNQNTSAKNSQDDDNNDK